MARRLPSAFPTLVTLAAAACGCATHSTDPHVERLQAEVRGRIDSAASACLEADIARLPCQDMPTDPDYVPDGMISQFGAGAVDAVRRHEPGFEEVLGGPVVTAVHHLSDQSIQSSAAQDAIEAMIGRFGDKIRHDHLDNCHAACLIECFTSKVIRYDDSAASDWWKYGGFGNPADQGPYVTAGTGQGICRNYASLAEELSDLIGRDLSTVLTHDGAHRVVGYSDGAAYYLFEPQRDPLAVGACQRYPTHD